MKKLPNINWKQIRKVKQHPFLLFQILFISLILFIPLFSIKPFSEASTNVLEDWVKQIDGASYSFFMTIDQPVMDGLNNQTDEELTLGSVALPILTSLPYQDIRLLFGHELPRFPNTDSTIVIAGEGTDMFTTAIETAPPDYLFEEQEDEEPVEEPEIDVADESVFIYTTHNRESFLPHLPAGTGFNESFHEEENVMKLSGKLQELLEQEGIKAYADQSDIWRMLPENQYSLSYDISRDIVNQAMGDNEQVNYLIDIHRDAQSHNLTTTEVNGQTMARLWFIVGGQNEHYKENLAFATELHQLLEENYPGLSRGVEVKESSTFNQDLSDHAILVEVGGVYNNYSELNLSLEALSDVFSDYYFEQEGE
ncbi:stage II sporulation protein P [Aquisalibacillus elongatus]|uniref:Stage II sporulation protein P n=1 Tax=Aquisalibacillus elongatus TaxID=485577 RepID=A0A3N5CAD0_9BACI|nr:stage II sporulation protein P [Aquisalibacillus elongatus]RPF55575.1 stage II sporulation protein P [Aquisalibacillus elongatus]